MIISADLTCFRKHLSLHVDFTGGLNVIRGPNEQGKTTLIEAVLYAYYGHAALRDTIAETVTWEHKESELKVVTVTRLGGVDYTFSRSKNAAQCTWTEAGKPMKVTGQTETSAKAAELLGADAKTAAALMMASQDGLLGALKDGPGAVSSIMAKLADFDLLDRVLDRASKTLSLGAEAPVRAKYEAAQADLEKVEADAPTTATIDFWASKRDDAQAQAATARAQREALQPAVQAAEQIYTKATTDYQAREAVKTELAALPPKLAALAAQFETVKKVVDARPAAGAIDAAKAKVVEAQNFQALRTAYDQVVSLPQYPVAYWEGDKASFDAELATMRQAEAGFIAAMQQANAAATAERKKKITNGKCPTCGAGGVSDEHVKEHNDKVEAQARVYEGQFNDASKAKGAKGVQIAEMLKVSASAARFEALAEAMANRDLPITLDRSVFPTKITWTGPIPSPADVPGLQRTVTLLEAAERAAVQAEGQQQVLRQQADLIGVQKADLEESLAQKPEVDLEGPKKAWTDLLDQCSVISQTVTELENEATVAEAQRVVAKQAFDMAQVRIEAARLRLVDLAGDLQTLATNNNFVAKLRKLKPAITDYLWNTVLAAASNFFSGLRGEKSVVTKEADGFKVNGHSVDSLSGSTRDVLALANRVALTKTFIPHAPFMSLDEPAHGCDPTRTSSVLGFLASVGFQQIILASHDELSESVADNVIALGD